MQSSIIDEIIKKVDYPKMLLKGLDDIDVSELGNYLSGEKVFALGIRLTNVCNYSCVYCGTLEKRGTQPENALTTEEYLDIIDQAADIGVSTIVLGGNGEPTLTKDIDKILKRIAFHHITPIIFSNIYIFGNDELCKKVHGTTGKELLDVFDQCGTSIIISCETTIPECYNKIVGGNHFEEFDRAIERIRKTRLAEYNEFNGHPLCRLAISSVVMPINYKDRFDMLNFAHSLNALIILKVPSLHGAAAKNIDLMFDVQNGKNIQKELSNISDKQATLQILNLACVAWTLGISISVDGNFMTCMTDESNPYGESTNVRNTKIKSLLGKRKELLKLRNTVCPVKDKYYV